INKSAKKFRKKNAPFMRSYALSLVILQLLAPMLILQIGVLHEIWMMMQYPKVLTGTKKVVWMRMVIKEANQLQVLTLEIEKEQNSHQFWLVH
ncbi:hypothetical protein PanWU01x14_217500, partial [Parasponia andersonii]